MSDPRQVRLIETFVDLADTLVDDFDLIDFLSLLSRRCVELFDVSESGVMLLDRDGRMRLIASSSHAMRLLELLEIQLDEGPCPDAYRTADAVQCADLRDAEEQWPTFATEALAAGFRMANAHPMRLRNEVIGALNLFGTEPVPLPATDVAAVQALADVATIGILQHRTMTEGSLLNEQLQYALNSRIVIEQAKGVVAQQLDLDMDEAFDVVRAHSRRSNQLLVDTARSIVDRTTAPDELAADQHTTQR